MIDSDFNKYVSDHLATYIEQNNISEEGPETRIVYQLRDQNEELDIGGRGGIVETRFDVIAQATNLGTVQQMAADIRALFHGFRGSMGGTVILMGEVKDHDDDFEPTGNDEGFHTVTLTVRFLHRPS